MRPNDKPAFLAVLNGLAAVKPGAKLTPEALDVWWLSFANWSIDEFKSAAATLAKSVEFFPNPYHFEQLRKQAVQVSAAEAWQIACDISRALPIGRCGPSDQGVSSGDPAIDAAAKAVGGYAGIANRNLEYTGAGSRKFAEVYEERLKAQESREALGLEAVENKTAAMLADLRGRLRLT